jgi:hypothetical protein
MVRKGFFEAFLEGWDEGSKGKITPHKVIKTAKSIRALRPQKTEPPYQWIRVARYIGEDTSLEPTKYRGFWRWLIERIK